MRIVLDTNVCLDLFVFRDPRWARLYEALKNSEVKAVTREDCRTEWLLVLDYPHLPLNENSKQQSMLEFDALIQCLPSTESAAMHSTVLLPLCSDSDDQKFLEAARDSRADVLITKDKALLKLAKRNARAGLFKIMSPEAWTLAFDAS